MEFWLNFFQMSYTGALFSYSSRMYTSWTIVTFSFRRASFCYRRTVERFGKVNEFSS